jgi:hypothetical protein
MNSPLLPQCFHKYRFYFTIFCCFHILSNSSVHLQTEWCVSYFNCTQKWTVLKCVLFFSLPLKTVLTNTQKLYNILPSSLCFLLPCALAAILIFCLAISGCTLWKLDTVWNEHKKYISSSENISNCCSWNKQLESQSSCQLHTGHDILSHHVTCTYGNM